jgi:phospholipid N-methyltransferase
LAIETNPVFAHALSEWPDQRLQVVEDDARKISAILKKRGLTSVDLVIASIPFTYLSKDDRAKFVADVKALLTPGGKLIIFHQYSPLMKPYLRKEFGRIHDEFEPLNVFPCFLMEGTKN